MHLIVRSLLDSRADSKNHLPGLDNGKYTYRWASLNTVRYTTPDKYTYTCQSFSNRYKTKYKKTYRWAFSYRYRIPALKSFIWQRTIAWSRSYLACNRHRALSDKTKNTPEWLVHLDTLLHTCYIHVLTSGFFSNSSVFLTLSVFFCWTKIVRSLNILN